MSSSLSLPELSGAPSLKTFVGEVRALAEGPRLLLNLPRLLMQPRGHGEPVIVMPGWATNDVATALLRTYLRVMGYTVSGWGLGFNRGNLPWLVKQMKAKTLALHEEAGQAVRLVGWSLGGVVCREIARDEPQAVGRVVTIGSPLRGPRYTSTSVFFDSDVQAIEQSITAREAVPISVPVTSIYSKRDGIVAWESCFDGSSENVEHLEVAATHMGMPISADVFKLVVRALAG